MVTLIALKPFTHSVGTIDAGQELRTSKTFAKSLIASGLAATKEAFDSRPKARWSGETAVVIGGGASVTTSDIELVKRWRYAPGSAGRRVLVINSSFLSVPWGDALYGADYVWWKVYHPEAKKIFQGELWSQHEEARKKFGTRFIQCEQRAGLSRIPGVIHSGGNSGFQAVGLLHDWGVSKQVLLGFDMQKTNGRSHHHGDHPAPLTRASPYEVWMRHFKILAHDLKAAKVRVINASRETALKEFDRMPLAQALEFEG